MKSALRLSLLVALLAVTVASQSRAEDKITLFAKNEVIIGRVTKEDVDGVDIEMKGKGKINYKPAEIAEIEWVITEPQEWREGYRAFKSGAYNRAADTFQGIIKDPESLAAFRPEAKAYLYYMAAEALYRAEKPGEAVPAFQQFMTDFPKSLYGSAAVGSMVDCAIQTGDFGKVPPLLNVLKNIGGDQKAQADYYEGKMLLAQKKLKEAEARFGQAVGGAVSPTTRGIALMGQASCAVEANDPAKARDLASKALAANPPRNVAAAAHVVIGDSILSEVESKKPSGDELVNAYLDALLAYMRVPLLYEGDRNTEPKAMYQTGDILRKMSKLANHGADRQRAITIFTRLTQDSRYRGSEYAAKAGEALKSFR